MTEQFDGFLAQIVQSQAGYEGFFDVIFGFLQRKTDYYSDIKKAELICKEKAEFYLKKFYEQKEESRKLDEIRKQKQQEMAQKKQEESKPVEQPKVVPQQSQPKVEESDKKENAPAEGKIMPNKGNGSQTETYIWTQTLHEITIKIPLEQVLTKNQLVIDLKSDHIKVAKKDGTKVYIDGLWSDKIAIDELNWIISDESGHKILEIYVLKWKTSMSWWDSLIKGEQPIDTQKINPESSKLSDLDGEMKSTVGKMMFDMQQKQQGLPTSDELEKRSKLDAFMKANPHLDFSKAKFS